MIARLIHSRCPFFIATRGLAKFILPKYQIHMLDSGPSRESNITKEEALAVYTDMAYIRRLEITLAKLYQQKVIRGFCHLYNGQEAIAVGIADRMRPEDSLITSYRAHGFAYLMNGKDPSKIIAELMGLESGCSKGKGGSMHVYAPHFYGGNGIVGAQVPLGTGIALANKYLGTNGVTFTIYGDGAANQGQVFESYNIAKLWNLPVVYVVENNMYGMGTSVDRSSANVNYFQKCIYVPGVLVDGMCLLCTRNAAEFAINYVMSGKGPIVLEMRTYRYFGHSMSDPGNSYRTRDEVASVRQQRDPMRTFRDAIVKTKLVTDEELDAIKKSVENAIAEVLKKVQKDKPLGLEHVSGDVIKSCLNDKIRGVTILKPLTHKNFPPPK